MSAGTKEENMEANINMLFELLSQKDKKISDLEKRVQYIEDKLAVHRKLG